MADFIGALFRGPRGETYGPDPNLTPQQRKHIDESQVSHLPSVAAMVPNGVNWGDWHPSQNVENYVGMPSDGTLAADYNRDVLLKLMQQSPRWSEEQINRENSTLAHMLGANDIMRTIYAGPR